ncbi:MAG: Na(+)-translocating NADH-quinone reductase subunit C [Pseudohongiellaceae bacterium]
MSSKDSIKSTLFVAFFLCVVCSIVVSGTAVVLKPMQDANRILDRNKNILSAAGLFDSAKNTDSEVDALFEQFTTRLVDLQNGTILSESEINNLGIDVQSYDQRLVLNDPDLSEAISPEMDQANVKRRALYQTIYLVENEAGLETIVLPISGYGLWGILYGYIALEGDANTVKGLAYYELKETPGLGAEVRNPRWMALWPGKKVYADDGEVGLSVVKGAGSGDYQIDGLSGATLTSRGVDDMIQYWLGEQGFGPVLKTLAN